MEEMRMRQNGLMWDQWDGERKTRWFGTEEEEGMFPMRWITTTAGMRWVTLSERTTHEAASKGAVTVRDFNPHQVEEVYLKIGGGVERLERLDGIDAEETCASDGMSLDGAAGQREKGPAMLTRRVVMESTVLSAEGFFAHPLISGLPYVETVTEEMSRPR